MLNVSLIAVFVGKKYLYESERLTRFGYQRTARNFLFSARFLKCLTMLGTTYLCESAFSAANYIENKQITD
jgi:hypothetical protein